VEFRIARATFDGRGYGVLTFHFYRNQADGVKVAGGRLFPAPPFLDPGSGLPRA